MMNFRLRDLLELYDSGTWGEESKCEQSYPVLRSSDIKLNKLIYDNPAFIKIPEKDLSRKMLIDGDIIVTKSSGSPELIGKCGIFRTQKSGQNYFFSNFMLRVRPIAEKLESRWLYYYLISPMGKSVLKRMSNTTSGLRNLNINYYLDQWIPLPSLSEQKRIADLLDRADSLRQKRRESLALLDEFLKSVFIDMFGDPVRNEKGWEVRRLGECIVETVSINPASSPEEVYEYIDISSVDNKQKVISGFQVVRGAEAPSRARQVIMKDDILVSTVRPNLNAVAMINQSYNQPLASTGFCVLRVDKNKMSSYFLFEICKHEYFINSLSKIAKGASYPAVTNNEVRNLRIFLPPMKQQKLFEDIVKRIELLKDSYSKSLIEMNNQFNALLQRAFRGEGV